MAQGDATLFDEFADQMGQKDQDFKSGGDVYKVLMITNGTVATAGDTTPTASDYTEVSGGTSYTAGGETVANQDWDYASGSADFIGDDVGWVYDASGPTNCYQAIVNNTTADKCIMFIDLTTDGGTTPLSLQDGPIDIKFTNGKILTGANA